MYIIHALVSSGNKKHTPFRNALFLSEAKLSMYQNIQRTLRKVTYRILRGVSITEKPLWKHIDAYHSRVSLNFITLEMTLTCINIYHVRHCTRSKTIDFRYGTDRSDEEGKYLRKYFR